MTTDCVTYRCSRCHRPLRHPVMVAGMPLGDTCARILAGAAAGIQTPERRRASKRAQEFQAAQLDIFAPTQLSLAEAAP